MIQNIPGCNLTNEQLITKCYWWIKELAESGGRKWSLRVPVDFNNDPDVLFSEVCKRLAGSAASEQRIEELLKALKDARDYITEDGELELLTVLQVIDQAIKPANH